MTRELPTLNQLTQFILDNYPQEVKQAIEEYLTNNGVYEIADRLGYFDEE